MSCMHICNVCNVCNVFIVLCACRRPQSCVLCLVSCALCPVSCVVNPVFRVLCAVSLCPVSRVLCPLCCEGGLFFGRVGVPFWGKGTRRLPCGSPFPKMELPPSQKESPPPPEQCHSSGGEFVWGSLRISSGISLLLFL